MSYELTFWKYEVEPDPKLHHTTYSKLSNGEHVKGLSFIPVDDITNIIDAKFSSLGWSNPSYGTWESEKGALDMFTTPQFMRVECYSLSADLMNDIIDVMKAFDLPLYDPQIDVRFSI